MAVVTLPFNTQGDLLCNFDDEEKSLFFNQPRLQTNPSSNINNNINHNIVNSNQNTLLSTSIQHNHNNNINNNNMNNNNNNINSLSLNNNLHQYPNNQVTQNPTSNHPPTELTDELSNFIFEESLLSDLYSESLPLENLLSSSGANIYPNLSSIVDTSSSSSSYVNQNNNNTVKYAAPALVNNYPALTALPSPLVPSLPLNIKSTDSSNSSGSSSSSSSSNTTISAVGQQQQQQQQQQQPTSVTSSVPLVVKGEPKESKEKLQVIVRHKPRGSKGIWQAIKPGERIRVDKRKGKLVLLAVRGKLPNIPASRFQEEVKLRVSLLDLKFPYFTLQQELVPLSITGPIIRTSETPEEKQTFGGNYSEVQIRVRMASISKRQGFTVTLVTKNCRMEGTSLEFSSDDNGKLYLPVGRKRKGQTSSSSSSSSISATNSSSDLHGALSNVEIKEEREEDGEETEVVSTPVVVSNGRPKRTRYSS